MGLCIAIETERHERRQLIADAKNLLHHLIGYPDAGIFPMLASIDYYGDTVFNRKQVERFLIEWETLFEKAATPDEKVLLEEVRTLAQKVRDEVHLYLVFIGD